MEWNKCPEKLPERDKEANYSQVPCIVIHDNEIRILVYNHEHMCWDRDDGDDYYCNIADVTHWMHVPAPPAKEER